VQHTVLRGLNRSAVDFASAPMLGEKKRHRNYTTNANKLSLSVSPGLCV
jgi:hypothetical protein